MEKTIKLQNVNIIFTLKVSNKSKSIRLAVYPGGQVIVTTPNFIPEFVVNRFIKSKSEWLINRIEYNSKLMAMPRISKKEQKNEYLKNKNKVKKIVEERLEYFNKFYNFKWNKITVRNQKTRWGSCSKKGNLNFNYKIAFLSNIQTDYIVVHELCHLKEFNHGKRFWNLVALTVSNYKEIRVSLKQNKLKLD
jgi:hypothetical protein